jgi:hypothetical protein
MTRLRQKQSEDARKNIQKRDCVNLMSCLSVNKPSKPSFDTLQMETKVRRLVQSGSTNKGVQYFAEGMWAHEWLNISRSRLIFLTLEEEDMLIQIFDKNGDIVRSISLKNTLKLTLKVNKDVDHSRYELGQ